MSEPPDDYFLKQEKEDTGREPGEEG